MWSIKLVKVVDFRKRDLGWTMQEIINVVVNIYRYEPLRGSFWAFVKLPADIQEKRR